MNSFLSSSGRNGQRLWMVCILPSVRGKNLFTEKVGIIFALIWAISEMPDSDYSNALVILLYKVTALKEGNSGERLAIADSGWWERTQLQHAASLSFSVFLIFRTSMLPCPHVWLFWTAHTVHGQAVCESPPSPFTQHRIGAQSWAHLYNEVTLNILFSYLPLSYLNTKYISCYLSLIYSVDFSIRTQRYKLFFFKTTQL